MKIKDNFTTKYLRERAREFKAGNGIDIRHGDFRDVCRDIPDNSIDCILTDPPYERSALPLWSELSKMARRVLKPSGWLIAYSGQLYLPEVLKRLTEYMEYYWTFTKIFKTGRVVYPRGVTGNHRDIIILNKPPRKVLRKKYPSDVIDGFERGDETLHSWGHPVGESIELLKLFTDAGDLVLDPMAGAGTVALACKKTNRRCIAIDIEKENVELIKGRLVVDNKPVTKQGHLD